MDNKKLENNEVKQLEEILNDNTTVCIKIKALSGNKQQQCVLRDVKIIIGDFVYIGEAWIVGDIIETPALPYTQ